MRNHWTRSTKEHKFEIDAKAQPHFIALLNCFMPKVVIFESTESLPKFYHAASRKSINDFKDDDSRIDHKQLADYIHEQVEVNGNPLVIGDFNTLPSWDRELFHLNRFLELYEDSEYE